MALSRRERRRRKIMRRRKCECARRAGFLQPGIIREKRKAGTDSNARFEGAFSVGCGVIGTAFRRRFRNAFAAAGAVTALYGAALAQSSIEARLVGPRGEAAAGVAVRAENASNGAVMEGVSDAQGRVRFGGLSSGGSWRLSTQGNEAFAPATSDAFSLRSEFQSNITLRLAQRKGDEIVVTGARTYAAFNTSNAEVSATLSGAEIDRIPVEARSLERLLFRLPGVTQSTGFFGEAPAISINGANALFTNYTIDGLDNNENFLGGQKFSVPVGAVQDVTVLSSSYSVEYGRTANGVVNVTTPSGGNDFKGDVFFLTRPGGFLSADPASNQTSLFGAPVSDTFARYQGGFAVSGPIATDRTFFFLNTEYLRDATDNILSAPLLGVNERVVGVNEHLLITGKIDHFWSERWRSSLRFNHGRVKLERQGGGLDGGVIFPSAGSRQDRFSTNVALTNAYSGDGFDYSGSFQYSGFDWNYGEPLAGEGPQAVIFAQADLTVPVAIIGHPGFIFDSTERTFQTQHKVTVDVGPHRLKAGADIIIADFSLFGGGNVNGNFTLALDPAQIAALQGVGADFSFSDLPSGATILNASFETQPNAFGTPQRIYSAYIEDQWQATDDLSLTLGLRWDYDSLTNIAGNGDFDNIAPRFAFNYSASETLAFRGGVGLFVEKIPYAIISDAIQQNSDAPGFIAQLQSLINQGVLPSNTDILRITTGEGNLSVNAAPLCSGLLACPDPVSLAPIADTLTNAERRIFNPFGLDNPQAIQASLGVEWQPHPLWRFGIDAQFSRGRNLLRLVDLNAPEPFIFNQAVFDLLGASGVALLTQAEREALGLIRSAAAADATRPAAGAGGAIPAGGARSIIVSDTGGRSNYRALIFKIQKVRGHDLYDASIFYTLSRLRNDTDDINFRANDSNNFAADFGPSLNDRTHVISSIFNFYPVDGLTLSVAGLFQSGQPVNFVPDAGVFGTTDINGDGLSFADQFTGNPDRQPGVSRNSGRLPWAKTVDVGAGYAFANAGPGGFEIRADFFNIFDANNVSGYPVNFTASNQIQVFGRPFAQNSAGAPRTFQLSLKYRF